MRSAGRDLPVLNGLTMNQAEFRTYHEREAVRVRTLAANTTTAALKARLMEEAEKHDQLAKGTDDLTAPAA